MDKAALRKHYIEKRKALTAEDVDRLSSKVVEHFFRIPIEHVRYLHIFYPIVRHQEFNSLLFAERLRSYYPSTRLVLPKSDLLQHTLRHILWTDTTELSINNWGITEPAAGQEISPLDIDMVVIPLLAFDRFGNRLGYGKGFYDRFLKECRPDVQKVGVSFFEPEERIPADEHDVPLTCCVTPERIWQF